MSLTRVEVKKLSNEQLLSRKRELEFLVSRYDNLQSAKKIQLNSCYGALGNKYFRMYDVRLAKSVTLSGQLVIKWIDYQINKFFNEVFGTETSDYVVFAHTDSMYIRLDKIVQKKFPEGEAKDIERVVRYLEKVCQTRIYPKIQEIFKQLSSRINAFENRMNMKIEVISDKGIWDGKNRYILNVYYEEGTFRHHPKMKAVGVETVKSSIPKICRDKISGALEIMLRENADSLRKFINDFRAEFSKLPPEDMAFPRGISKIAEKMTHNPKARGAKKTIKLETYDKPGKSRKVKSEAFVGEDGVKPYLPGTTIHIKAAILHNDFIEKNNLQNQYELIKEGDKIKYIYLLDPENNPIGDSVVAFKNALPKEMGLEDKIDVDKMFESAFLNPVTKIMDVIGWTLNEPISFASMFGWE